LGSGPQKGWANNSEALLLVEHSFKKSALLGTVFSAAGLAPFAKLTSAVVVDNKSCKMMPKEETSFPAKA
jgi:hypothetical protein